MSRARILPEGSEIVGKDETVLWEGRPSLAGLARQLFHVRAIVGYFALLALYQLAMTHNAGFQARPALLSIAWLVLPAVAAAAILYLMAWVLVLTTRYTITDRRVIMQIGVALPIALTLPLRQITGAGLRLHADGSGDIPLALGDQKIAYLLIWPHARPWRFLAPEPMMRALPDGRKVAQILSGALVNASPTGEAKTIETIARPDRRATPGVATA
jgi:hypothetical protein